jgi:hypothetical protein
VGVGGLRGGGGGWGFGYYIRLGFRNGPTGPLVVQYWVGGPFPSAHVPGTRGRVSSSSAK